MKKCELTVPQSMTKDTREYLINELTKKFGLTCVPEVITDCGIIGGFIFNNNGKITDCSVKSQLEAIKKHITE